MYCPGADTDVGRLHRNLISGRQMRGEHVLTCDNSEIFRTSGTEMFLHLYQNNIDNKEAVRKGVVDYLDKRKSQTGLDMSLMNVEVTNVTFEKNEARATVANAMHFAIPF